MATTQVIDGVPYKLHAVPGNPKSTVEFKHCCCDCGLQHDVTIDVPAEVKGIDITFSALAVREEDSISLHAENVYPIWKKAVKKAKYRITVFSPYFDYSLIQLLQNTNLSVDSIQVITDFSAQTLLEHPAQLKTIQALLEKGIAVKHLPGLHAQVLLVDGGTLVLGSQNVTRAGKLNWEVSGFFPRNKITSPFAQKLKAWIEEAEEIDPELVKHLLEKVEPLHKQYETLVRETQQALEEAKSD